MGMCKHTNTSTERSKARSLMMMTDNNNKKEAGGFLNSAPSAAVKIRHNTGQF